MWMKVMEGVASVSNDTRRNEKRREAKNGILQVEGEGEGGRVTLVCPGGFVSAASCRSLPAITFASSADPIALFHCYQWSMDYVSV